MSGPVDCENGESQEDRSGDQNFDQWVPDETCLMGRIGPSRKVPGGPGESEAKEVPAVGADEKAPQSRRVSKGQYESRDKDREDQRGNDRCLGRYPSPPERKPERHSERDPFEGEAAPGEAGFQELRQRLSEQERRQGQGDQEGCRLGKRGCLRVTRGQLRAREKRGRKPLD